MSQIRHHPHLFFKETQRSIEPSKTNQEKQHKYSLLKLNKHKNRHNVRSLHSIQVNKNEYNMPKPQKKSKRRQLITLDSEYQLKTERKSKDFFIDFSIKKPNINDRYSRQRAMTIDQQDLQFKQRKIKDCIEIMQGYLHDLKNVKSSRSMFKSLNCHSKFKRSKQPNNIVETVSMKNQQQDHIAKDTKPKNDNSKVILVRKCKTKSALLTINNRQSQVSIQFRQQRPKIMPNKLKKQTKQNLYTQKQAYPVQNKLSTLQAIQQSMIDRINQSSFISDLGKKCLIKQLDIKETSRTRPDRESIQNASKRVLRIVNNKKLKNLFPDDFF